MNISNINGFYKAEWEDVFNAFIENYKEGLEIGSCICIYENNVKCVELYGGYSHKKESKLFQPDTLVNVYSASKGVANTCILKLVDNGHINYDTKIASIWPEFGCNGKENITLEQLLTHQAGLSHIDEPIHIKQLYEAQKNPNGDDAQHVFKVLSKQIPHQSKLAYSPFIIGLYIVEIVKRVDPKHRDIHQYFREEIGKPHDIDFHFTLNSEVEPRVARLYELKKGNEADENEYSELSMKAYRSIMGFTPWRGRYLQLPSAVGFVSAESLAKLYQKISTEQICSKDVLNKALTISYSGFDDILEMNRTFYKSGFANYDIMSNDFGHGGFGGALGWADPIHNISVGYVCNALESYDNVKQDRIMESVKNCIINMKTKKAKL